MWKVGFDMNDPGIAHTKNESIEVLTFPVYPLGCNCSIVRCTKTGEALVVDPGGDAPRILKLLRDAGSRVRWIVHTHAHFDHCLGTHAVARECPGIEERRPGVAMHPGDFELYENLELQCRAFGVPGQKAETPIDHSLEDDEVLRFGKAALRVLHTPGHSPGSCSFEIEESGLLFSGDTLFQMGIGRTDLWGGDSAAIMKSIRTRLFTLDDGTTVIPGHGPFTRIFEEKQANPFF